MVATDELSEGVARQHASDLRLFSLVEGIVDVTAIEQFHLSQYRDALAKVPKNFLRSDKDQDLTIKALTRAHGALRCPAFWRMILRLSMPFLASIFDPISIAGLKAKMKPREPKKPDHPNPPSLD